MLHKSVGSIIGALDVEISESSKPMARGSYSRRKAKILPNTERLRTVNNWLKDRLGKTFQVTVSTAAHIALKVSANPKLNILHYLGLLYD